jgi:hypothetical protein
MDNTKAQMTLDAVNLGIYKFTLAKALATLNRYAMMDTGDLYVALADKYAFYTSNSVRPEGQCDVWVMAGKQPISFHGAESNDAYSSACAMIMGLKIAKAFGANDHVMHGLGAPWLDDLSMVMLRAKKDVETQPASIPLYEDLYNEALQHGVDMTIFRVHQNTDEHF